MNQRRIVLLYKCFQEIKLGCMRRQQILPAGRIAVQVIPHFRLNAGCMQQHTIADPVIIATLLLDDKAMGMRIKYTVAESKKGLIISCIIQYRRQYVELLGPSAVLSFQQGVSRCIVKDWYRIQSMRRTAMFINRYRSTMVRGNYE